MYIPKPYLTCCLFLLMCFGLAVGANAAQDQEATFANVEIIENEVVAGIHGIAIRFDVRMKYAGEAVLKPGESSISYSLSAMVRDEFGAAMSACEDSDMFRSESGQCRDSSTLVQAKFHQNYEREALFIPYYALSLLPGKRKLEIELQLRDSRDGRLVGKSAPQAFSFDMPASKRFRMVMKYIEVTEKDANDDPWDYAFLNPKEVFADTRWSLHRGEELVYLGEKQKNMSIYRGDPELDRTGYFTLTEGDLLSLQVADFDLITFSDLIGNVVLNPWEGRLATGKIMDLKFGQVISALFQLENLAEPQMLISGFDVAENVKQDGVTGTKVSFDYQLKYNVLGARFVVQLTELMGGKGIAPRFVRLVEGRAEPLGSGAFRLGSNKGKVVLFVPWYGLEQQGGASERPLMRMSGVWQLDGQQFAMGKQQQELVHPVGEIKDMVFGQWKAGTDHRSSGMSGLMFSCDYKLSGRYFEDLDSAEIRLYPELHSQAGVIPAGYLDHLAPVGGNWDDNALLLTPEVDSGSLQLFLPFHQMPEGLDKLDLSLDYHADLAWEGRTTSLGVFRLKQEVGLPEIDKLTISVQEVAAGRKGLMGPQADLEWRIRIGDKEMYRSRTIYGEKTAKWGDTDAVTLRLTDIDLVKIEIYQLKGGEAQLVSSWEGRMRDFPVRPTGDWKLKMEGLRKVIVKVARD